ncbi:MAG: hypothetical protein DRQ04_07465 [Candidatus Hydrothermota bacterium]|nr:MAG: hypothetical protein DRQ04_07465 [Candidatus Hydrothermae bacterium]
MRSIIAIFGGTLKEGVRSKLFWGILVFALLLFLSTMVVSELSFAEKEKIIADLGLSLISAFGLIAAVILGTDLIYRDIQNGTIQIILARPVKRWKYVAGKYLGLMAIIGVNLLLLSLMLLFVLLIYVGKPCIYLLRSLYTIFLELSLIASIGVFFSTFSTSQLLSSLVTLGLFIIGHSLDILRMSAGKSGKFLGFLLKSLAVIFPDLDFYDIKIKVIHGLPLESSYYSEILLYTLGYVIFILFLASLIMERREFR